MKSIGEMKMSYYICRIWDKDVLDILRNRHAFSIDQEGADNDFTISGIPNIQGRQGFQQLIELEQDEIIIFLGCR
jgi:hypothetical protein